MTNKRYPWSAALTALLAAFLVSRVALAVDEAEPNDPYADAQAIVLDSDGTLTIDGSILNTIAPAHRDVDFYSFTAHKGETYTFNIDGGMKNGAYGEVATDLAVFGPVDGTVLLPLRQMNVGIPIDSPGSVSGYDARIDDWVVPATGTYVVGVTSYPASFIDIDTLYLGGTLYQTSPLAGIPGTYKLLVSLTKPALQSINIDIRPGRRDVIWTDLAVRDYSRRRHAFGRDNDNDRHHRFEGLRHRFKHGLPVALLSSDTFDATQADPSSLKFGSTGDEDSFIRCGRRGVDVNHDGIRDLICWFDVAKSDFVPGDNEGVLTGSTKDGEAFEGRGALKILTGKRRHHHEDRRKNDHRDRDRHHRHHDRR